MHELHIAVSDRVSRRTLVAAEQSQIMDEQELAGVGVVAACPFQQSGAAATISRSLNFQKRLRAG